jgi:PPOX class probable F420-dependent enzyme
MTSILIGCRAFNEIADGAPGLSRVDRSVDHHVALTVGPRSYHPGVAVRNLAAMPNQQALESLGRAKNLRLTTFRRDGSPVATPVWVVRDGDHLLVITSGKAGKAKRLRHTSRVLIAPSDARGRVKPGVEDVAGTAELITDEAEVARLETLLKGRYGFMYTVAPIFMRLRGLPTSEGTEIRISL